MQIMKLVLGALMLAAPLTAAAEDAYPTKPITALVGFETGGGTDTIARIIADKMGEQLGQRINVVNKTGAGGGLAVMDLVQSAPDGYKIYISPTSPITAGPLTNPALTFGLDNLNIIALIHPYQAGIVAPITAPYNDLAEFVAWAKGNPGVNYVFLTALSRPLLEKIAEAEALEINFIPAKGGSDAINLMAGGQADLAYSGGYHTRYTDSIKLIAPASLDRHAANPDKKTIAEYGYPAAIDSHLALAVPAGTPETVIAKLDAALTAALATEEVKTILSRYEYTIDHLRGEAARARVVQQSEYYQQMLAAKPAN